MLLWERVECAGKSYSMWGFGWSRLDWIECVRILSRCVVFLCSTWVVIYYAASLLFFVMLCCVIVLHDILGLWGLLTGCLCFLPYVGYGTRLFLLWCARMASGICVLGLRTGSV